LTMARFATFTIIDVVKAMSRFLASPQTAVKGENALLLVHEPRRCWKLGLRKLIGRATDARKRPRARTISDPRAVA